MPASPNTIGWIVLLFAAGLVLLRLLRRTTAKRRTEDYSGGNGGNGDFGGDHRGNGGEHGHHGGDASGDGGGDGGGGNGGNGGAD